MLRLIIKREILEHILSWRFSLTFMLVLLVMAVSGFGFTMKYEQMVADYSRNVNINHEQLRESSKKLADVANELQRLFRAPNPLEFVAAGHSKDLPNMFEVNIFKIEEPKNKRRSNFMLTSFADVDWVFVISVILSFAAILFTYDAISGERERGTLRLLMSNSVSKATVLVGKFLGSIISITVLFLVGIIFNPMVITSLGVPLSGGDWAKIGLVAVISLVYISAFLMLGLLISSMTRESSTTIVALLFVWVIFVVIIPNSGGLLASQFYDMPTRREISERIQDAKNVIYEREKGKDTFSWRGTPKKKPVRDSVRRRVKAANDMTTGKNRVRDDYRNKIVQQVKLAQNITRISPSAVYQYASESIVGSGLARFESFMRQVKVYQQMLTEFVKVEDLRDKDSFHLITEEVWTGLFGQKPVNYNAIPKFAEKNISTQNAMQVALWDILLLVLFNLIFFMGAFVSFLRYDVR